MLRINKVLFDLSTVYESLTQAETWSMANTLTKVKFNLEDLLGEIQDHQLFDNHYKEQKDAIESQLTFVNANIKTLQDALLCHETKFIEKRTNLGDLGVFCLN
jgi:predicted  nucleic acid-binding Zn-ribbon protein